MDDILTEFFIIGLTFLHFMLLALPGKALLFIALSSSHIH